MHRANGLTRGTRFIPVYSQRMNRLSQFAPWALVLLLIAVVVWQQVRFERVLETIASGTPTASQQPIENRMEAIRQQARGASTPPTGGTDATLSPEERIQQVRRQAGAAVTPAVGAGITMEPVKPQPATPEQITELKALAPSLDVPRVEEILTAVGADDDEELAEQLRPLLDAEERIRSRAIAQAEAGELSASEARDFLARIREEFDPDVEGLLTPEAYETYLSLRDRWSEAE